MRDSSHSMISRRYALKTVLDAAHGFYGLVAAGWDIADTTGKGTRGPLPDDAVAVEQIVGMFDAERASGNVWSASEFNEYAAAYAASHGRTPLAAQFLGHRWCLTTRGDAVRGADATPRIAKGTLTAIKVELRGNVDELDP